ncbi:MAG: glycoside hydrolase family 78 protein [Cyclobacteriaceae bacterium]|nr:glycoside hydrolase family 78 protein [Cyclobacteriaceae bacterium]
MKINLLTVLLLTTTWLSAQVPLQQLKTENRINPIGLDATQPRFSWQLASTKRGTAQTAYEINVTDSKGTRVWASGKVESDQSQWVTYQGAPLKSGQTYTWRARVWDQQGKPGPWSTPATWQTALFAVSDWQARWIESTLPEGEQERPSPVFRKSFSSAKPIRKATAFITSHGLYEAWINGKRVGDAWLTPGWTSYNKRLQYQQFDVTGLLTAGDNAIGVELGSGWYRGYIGFSGQKNFYGKQLGLLFQLQIEYADGTTAVIASDASWKCGVGSVVDSDVYNGETIDARKEIAGWKDARYNDSQWASVKVVDGGMDHLVATYNEPVKKREVFKAIRVITTPRGEKVVDFGQNLTGLVQVKVKGKAGDVVRVYHAEVLDKAGNFYTDNLRAAKQLNTYILSGRGEETFEPRFTFQGFRYIRVEGYPGDIRTENFTAVAMYSDIAPTGEFSCSSPLVNQLQHNIQWGQRGNFLDVPTDCPQRDERLGWTGDAQAFSRTAAFNFDVHNFFSKWLKDLAADQVQGSVPFVVPNVLGSEVFNNFAGGSAGWADAATIIPWNMYLAYGDSKVLEEQYESMTQWIGYMERNSTNDLWNKGFHFGDWLFYRPFDDNDGRSAVTDKYLIAQCFFAHSTELMIRTAKLLGRSDDVTKYTQLLDRVKAAFLREYSTPSGRLVSGTQTAYVLALNFDMLPEALRPQAVKNLVDNIHAYDDHLTTGFLGTPYLCHVLSRFGHTDLAYKLLMQESYPSWLYPVKMGATTIWERWDGIKPDSTFQTPGMNSFNHYAYGAIGDWMYRVATGIDTEETGPGYKSIVIHPHTGGGWSFASASQETLYGKVKSSWRLQDGRLTLEVQIPANTSAKIILPTRDVSKVSEGNQAIAGHKDVKLGELTDAGLAVQVKSGTYSFVVNP